jgi:hypothetical protein
MVINGISFGIYQTGAYSSVMSPILHPAEACRRWNFRLSSEPATIVQNNRSYGASSARWWCSRRYGHSYKNGIVNDGRSGISRGRRTLRALSFSASIKPRAKGDAIKQVATSRARQNPNKKAARGDVAANLGGYSGSFLRASAASIDATPIAVYGRSFCATSGCPIASENWENETNADGFLRRQRKAAAFGTQRPKLG